VLLVIYLITSANNKREVTSTQHGSVESRSGGDVLSRVNLGLTRGSSQCSTVGERDVRDQLSRDGYRHMRRRASPYTSILLTPVRTQEPSCSSDSML